LGGGYGKNNGLSYSVGIVDNFEKPSDYSKHFVDVNIGNRMGIDHCFDPTRPYNETTNAKSVTFGMGSNYGIGYDYYSDPFIITEWTR